MFTFFKTIGILAGAVVVLGLMSAAMYDLASQDVSNENRNIAVLWLTGLWFGFGFMLSFVDKKDRDFNAEMREKYDPKGERYPDGVWLRRFVIALTVAYGLLMAAAVYGYLGGNLAISVNAS